MVVCYDAHASPIRDMQRCGRTGRHRGGRVVQLLALGKDEASYAKQQMVHSAYNFQELEKQQKSGLDCIALPCCGLLSQSTCMQTNKPASHDAVLLRAPLLCPLVKADTTHH